MVWALLKRDELAACSLHYDITLDIHTIIDKTRGAMALLMANHNVMKFYFSGGRSYELGKWGYRRRRACYLTAIEEPKYTSDIQCPEGVTDGNRMLPTTYLSSHQPNPDPRVRDLVEGVGAGAPVGEEHGEANGLKDSSKSSDGDGVERALLGDDLGDNLESSQRRFPLLIGKLTEGAAEAMKMREPR